MTELTEEDVGDFLPETLLYAERETGIVVEAQLFDGFVMYRSATPDFNRKVYRLKTLDFIKRYDEYAGDVAELRAYLEGWGDSPIVVDFY